MHMSNYKTLFHFEKPWFVSDLTTSKTSERAELNLWFQVESGHESKSIELEGLDDLDLVSSILQAEKVVVSEEVNSQIDFGTIRVECWIDNCYSEFWCNKAEF